MQIVDCDDEDDESVADARLAPGTLARFVDGLSWLLEWSKAERQWRLTEAGKAHVRGVS